jgi:hypothetical protein
MNATLTTRNLERGKWAVSMSGYRGWRRDSALGDGITSALHALVGRFETKEEAEAEARRLNDAQPHVLPGSSDVPVFEARRYDRTDYIPGQQLRTIGARDCDRRIAKGW